MAINEVPTLVKVMMLKGEKGEKGDSGGTWGAISGTISNQTDLVNLINTNVQNEATARENAIAIEISTRQADDTSLRNQISSEVTARQNADTSLSNQITALQGAVGSPLKASTVSAMTDTSKIYVYTGSESGYTNGNWYYYNGSSWVSGGVYNSVAIETDTTLSVSGMPADAGAVGVLKEDINNNKKLYNHSIAVFETAKSYLNVAFDPNNRLAYAEGIGLFQPNTRNDSGYKCISCSQFVQACISGIDYGHSRYVKSSNEVTDWGFLSGNYGNTMIDYGDYLTSNEMGNFFLDRGQLRELSSTSPQAKVGDILLFSDGESFYHAAICTGVTKQKIYFLHSADKGAMFPEGLPRICDSIEAGVYLRYLVWSSPYAPTHYVSAKDVITDTIPIIVNRIVYDSATKQGSYSGTSAFVKSITKDFDNGLYTVKIKDDGTGDSRFYIRLNYYKEDGTVPSGADESKYSENIEFVQNQEVFKAIFYAQLPIRRIDIRCNGGTTYGYKSMEMYDNAINY